MNKPKLHAVPEWFDGKRINEVLFSQDFLDRYPMKCINGQLFTEDGAMEDEEWVKQLILNEIRDCITTGLHKRVSNLLEVVKLQAYSQPLPMETDCIHVGNGIYFLDGRFLPEKEIETLSAEAAPKEVVDYTEKLTVLQYALEQYTNWDEGQDVPESVIEAFVAKIVVSKDGFDWYLRFDGDPDKPLHCELQGKRKTNTKITVSSGCSPAMDCSPTGCYQNWGGISCTSNFPSVSRKQRSIAKPMVSTFAQVSGKI